MAKDSRDCRLIDYVETVLAPFDEVSFCPVDSAVLAQLAMVRVERVVSGEDESLGPRDLLLAERFDGMFAGFEPELDKQLLFAAGREPALQAPAHRGRARPVRPRQGDAVRRDDVHLPWYFYLRCLPGD